MTEEDIDKAVLEAFKKVFPEHFGEEMEIVPCENGVGEWEISPTHETFDTYQEAKKRLAEYKFNGNYEEEMNEQPEGINKQKCA